MSETKKIRPSFVEWTMNRIAALGGVGILRPDDLPELDSQRGRVLMLMLDGRWHDAREIVAIAGGSEGLRRLRELRALPGVHIDRMRLAESRLYAYQLTFQQEPTHDQTHTTREAQLCLPLQG